MRTPKIHAYTVADGTWIYLVAACNAKEAARYLRTTVGSMNRYGGRREDGSDSHRVALSDSAVVWRRPEFSPQPVPWVAFRRITKDEL